jgi:branched-chain amino acid transport system ATP-binding protein
VSLLEVSELSAGYGQGIVLHGIAFTVDEGRIVSILGPNGAGKTTSLRAVCGMLPEVHGSIAFDGRELRGRRPDEVARAGIAHVPEGRGTFTELTVEENLLVGAFTRGDKDVRADVDRWCERFPRLGERRRQQGGSLSGGEQQMLAVARALMLRPRLLLLDEPSLGLAPILTGELFRILEEIAREEGITVLVVEQNANLVLRFADHAYLLESGRIALEGDAETMRADEGVRRSYLGV